MCNNDFNSRLFFFASASCSRGAESLLAFLLQMLSERSRYTVSQSQPCGPDLTQSASPTHPSLSSSPAPLHWHVWSAGPAMWPMLRVERYQLCFSGCDISAVSSAESYCDKLHPCDLLVRSMTLFWGLFYLYLDWCALMLLVLCISHHAKAQITFYGKDQSFNGPRGVSHLR